MTLRTIIDTALQALGFAVVVALGGWLVMAALLGVGEVVPW